MIRLLALLMLLPLPVSAETSNKLSGPTDNRVTSVATCPDGSVVWNQPCSPALYDLVVIMRDGRLVLVRKLDACKTIMATFQASPDVSRAECVPQ